MSECLLCLDASYCYWLLWCEETVLLVKDTRRLVGVEKWSGREIVWDFSSGLKGLSSDCKISILSSLPSKEMISSYVGEYWETSWVKLASLI